MRVRGMRRNRSGPPGAPGRARGLNAHWNSVRGADSSRECPAPEWNRVPYKSIPGNVGYVGKHGLTCTLCVGTAVAPPSPSGARKQAPPAHTNEPCTTIGWWRSVGEPGMTCTNDGPDVRTHLRGDDRHFPYKVMPGNVGYVRKPGLACTLHVGTVVALLSTDGWRKLVPTCTNRRKSQGGRLLAHRWQTLDDLGKRSTPLRWSTPSNGRGSGLSRRARSHSAAGHLYKTAGQYGFANAANVAPTPEGRCSCRSGGV